MLGSAVQNGVALSDSIFLFYHDETDFAAIGIVSVFYLIISAIGYGFSKGGQILIARRNGEGNLAAIGSALTNMMIFQGAVAVVLFLGLFFGAEYFLGLFINNPLILTKCLEYLEYRNWGIFFSYFGLSYIALYTGVARSTFIVIDVLIMMLCNFFLNYVLIFGKLGFPYMGIAGAGLASSISEAIAFIAFFLYVRMDPMRKVWDIKVKLRIDFEQIRQIAKIGLPVVIQSIIGLGSWFVFFAYIEKLGEKALAITNFGRILYLFFSIPLWGYSSGINTIVSFLIGQNHHESVKSVIKRTALLCVGTTMILAAPFLAFPGWTIELLSPAASLDIMRDAVPVLRIILVILVLACVGAIYYNGLVGTGDTWSGLWIQIIGIIGYVIYIHFVISVADLGFTVGWTGEIFYWLLVIIMTILYVRGGRWKQMKI